VGGAHLQPTALAASRWRIKGEYTDIGPAMARRPNREKEEILTEKDLKERRKFATTWRISACQRFEIFTRALIAIAV